MISHISMYRFLTPAFVLLLVCLRLGVLRQCVKCGCRGVCVNVIALAADFMHTNQIFEGSEMCFFFRLGLCFFWLLIECFSICKSCKYLKRRKTNAVYCIYVYYGVFLTITWW